MSQQHPFGYWLKRSRKALDLTQAELANQVGCSSETIRKIEAQERRPSAQIVERLNREQRRTVVLVTHDLGEAYQLGDRLILYEAGRVVQAGPKSEVLGRPA